MDRQYCGSKAESAEGDEDGDFSLNYYVLQSKKYFDELNKSLIMYGVQIEKCIGEYNNESSAVVDITSNKERINEIINLLMNNSVTPIHLYDVIVDLI